MNDTEIKQIVAENIVRYRKQANLTQLELGERLNYSDKSISKWERGEALPDIVILKQLADLFKIPVDDFLKEKPSRKRIHIEISIEKRVIIPIMVVLLVFLISTIVFGFFLLLAPEIQKPWLCYVYAIPVAAICCIVFSALWYSELAVSIFVSALVWFIALLLYLQINLENNFIFFIIAIPGQFIIVLWFLLLKLSKRRKNAKERL